MKAAATNNPVHDAHRLAALRGTGLLDAPASATFDRLTRLVTQLLQVPVALVTLVDDDRQFFAVTGDPDRLVQVLVNLAANAIKFSPRGSTVTVRATHEGSATQFAVRDSGRGIPPDKLESIFERFQQVEPDDAVVKRGAGLGLAICRAIVGRHGGRIWAENNEGAGATFHVTIPDAA